MFMMMMMGCDVMWCSFSGSNNSGTKWTGSVFAIASYIPCIIIIIVVIIAMGIIIMMLTIVDKIEIDYGGDQQLWCYPPPRCPHRHRQRKILFTKICKIMQLVLSVGHSSYAYSEWMMLLVLLLFGPHHFTGPDY